MRKFIFLISFLVTLITPLLCFSQAGWYTQNSGTTRNLNDIFFIDQKTGWAVGDSGKVVKTTNGGFQWIQQNSSTTVTLNKVQFLNSNTGWAVGGTYVTGSPCWYWSVVIKTTNSGQNWTTQYLTSNGLVFNDLNILDSNTVYNVGEAKDFTQCLFGTGGAGKTTDGGSNWSSLSTPPLGSFVYKSLSFINNSTGYITVIFSSDVIMRLRKILKTTNAGNNWTIIRTDSLNGPVFENNFLRFFNENTGYYINGNFLKTTDGGNNWSKFDSLSVYNMKNFSFLNLNTGYLTGQNKIVKTSNGGTNWIINSGATFTGLNSISAVDTNHVWACGNGGKIVYGGQELKADTAVLKYFPLKIGNSWAYYWQDPNMQTGYQKTTIIGDSIIENIRYFKVDRIFPGYTVTGTPGKLVTIDSLTGNIFVYNPNSSCSRYSKRVLMDSLNARKNDAIVGCPNLANGLCRDTGTALVFGSNTRFKSFTSPYTAPLEIRHTYSDKFGITDASITEIGSTGYHLTGCTIDGVVYGDTAVFSKYTKYLPLQVGNSWTYRNYCTFPPLDDTTTITITAENTSGGIKYFTLSSALPTLSWNIITLDTLTGNVFGYESGTSCARYPNRVLIDSLGAKNGDTVRQCPSFSISGQCRDTVINVFGNTVNTKKFFYQGGAYPGRTYSEKFGLIYAYTSEIDFISHTLLSCRINGINYGSSAQTVAGSVKFSDNNQAATNGYVKAIKLNKANGTIITFDSVQIGSNGEYILHNLPIDTCYIVAYPNSEMQADFVPTYFPSTIHWQAAAKVYTGNNPSNINVSVYRKSSVHSTFAVNGWVMPQTNIESTGINSAVVYVKEGNIFRDYFVTGATGQYNVNELASGSYLIVADRLGYTDAQQNVTVTNSNLDNVNFSLVPTFVGIYTISNVLPEKYYLYQNYPNPFNPVTNIKFDIPKSSFISLKIYNVLGKEVSILLNEVKDGGSYRVDFDASALPSGVYFYRLETATFTETRRMMLLK